MDEKKQDAPEAGAPKVEGLDEIEKEIKRPRPKKKAKRHAGRPTRDEQKVKEAEEAEERAVETEMLASAVGGGVGALCGLLFAPRLGDHWNLTEAEKKAIGEVWAAPLSRWMPTVFTSHPEEAKAVIVTLGIFGPRVEKTRKLLEKEAAKQAETPRREPGSGTELTKAQTDHNKEAAG